MKTTTTSTKAEATMTDQSNNEAQLARVAQLQRQRAARSAGTETTVAAGPAAAPRRRRAATGSKIAAVGVGMTGMFGLIGAMALAQRPAAAPTTNQQPTVSVPPAQVVVVIHQDGTTATTPGAAPTATPAAPIPLVAQPIIQQAPVAQKAPVAKSSGSH